MNTFKKSSLHCSQIVGALSITYEQSLDTLNTVFLQCELLQMKNLFWPFTTNNDGSRGIKYQIYRRTTTLSQVLSRYK